MSAATVVEQRIAELVAQRVPFVKAVVVRARRPSSASPGDTALVLADGHIEGFVGGTCAEATVRRYGLEALQTGQPVLVHISPEGLGDGVIVEGAATVGNPCLSGGELEIFLEPRWPAPRVLVLGDTPIGRSLVAVGASMGYDIETVGDGSSGPALAGASAVVVASHGRGEEALLANALRHGVPYVGLVASPTRGAAVLAALDVTPAQRAGVRTPAGLDLGARTAGEVAVSILAEIVASVRYLHLESWSVGQHSEDKLGPDATTRSVPAADAVPVPHARRATHAASAIDPVCGMSVAAVDSTEHTDIEGRRWWFCCQGCQATFEASPRVAAGDRV